MYTTSLHYSYQWFPIFSIGYLYLYNIDYTKLDGIPVPERVKIATHQTIICKF